MVGGREVYDDNGVLETGAKPNNINNFQGRYIIRNAWEGSVNCNQPTFDRWGGKAGPASSPSTSAALSPNSTPESAGSVTSGGASNPDAMLEDYVAEPIPELDVEPSGRFGNGSSGTSSGSSGGGGCALLDSRTVAPLLLGLVLLTLFAVRRRQRHSQND